MLSKRLSVVLGVAVACAGSAIVGLLSARNMPLALAFAGFLGLIAAAVFGRASGPPTVAQFRWIPWAWLGLLLATEINLQRTGRTPLDAASGNASSSNIVELGIYGLVALLVAVNWITARQRTRVGFFGPLLLWPAFAVLSTTWSIIPSFTLVRAAQLVVVVALGALFGRVWCADPDVGRFLWERTLRWFVVACSALTIYSLLVFGQAAFTRFGWAGQHPTATAVFLALALIILIVGGRAVTRFSRFAYGAQITLLLMALLLTRTRGSLAGFAAGILLAVWIGGGRKAAVRYLGTAYLLVVGIIVWVVASQQVAVYLARGQDQESLLNLTGRIPLWTFALNDVREAGNWWQGFGYGASRVTLFSKVDWAGTAHNAWLEILIGTGMIGLALSIIGFFYLGYRLLMQASFSSYRSSALGASLFVVCLVVSITQPAFALPGLEFSLLLFLYGYSTARRTAALEVRDPAADFGVNLAPAR